VSWAIDASRNHGNFSKDTNNSSPPTSSQKPCGETFETSTDEVPVPSGTDFIRVILNQGQRQSDLSVTQTMILRQGYLGLKPEFCFPVRALHVNMAPEFLAGEEIESEDSVPKDRGAHRMEPRDRAFGHVAAIHGHGL
jgi:hypothetical protein